MTCQNCLPYASRINFRCPEIHGLRASTRPVEAQYSSILRPGYAAPQMNLASGRLRRTCSLRLPASGGSGPVETLTGSQSIGPGFWCLTNTPSTAGRCVPFKKDKHSVSLDPPLPICCAAYQYIRREISNVRYLGRIIILCSVPSTSRQFGPHVLNVRR